MSAAENAASVRDLELAHRAALCHCPATLDGVPAAIGGVREPFATVAQLGGPVRLEWSWDAVARIVNAGGAFRS